VLEEPLAPPPEPEEPSSEGLVAPLHAPKANARVRTGSEG